MRLSRRLPPWRAAPGLVVAGLFICFSVILLVPVPYFSGANGILYLTGLKGAESAFFFSLFTLLSGMSITYIMVTEHDLSRYTLVAVGVPLLTAESRYGIDSNTQIASVFVGLLFTSVLLAEVMGADTDSKDTLFESLPTGLFQLAAVTAYGLLAAGMAAIVVSVTFFSANPPIEHGSTAAIERLVGDKAAHSQAMGQFYAVVAATVFLAVFTDATRHTEIRWLTALTLVVDFAATGLLTAQTRWNATVAAVGTLLTVTLVATVLSRRYHTPFSDAN